jgi:putative Holliday junction resolvase
MLAMLESSAHITALAFDFGLKQIGVAYGQTLTGSANGLSIVKASDGAPDWSQISFVIDEWKPDILLVGLPLNMDDSESELSQRARRFARRLQGRFGLEVRMVDERLTSREAKSMIHEDQRNSGRRGKVADLTKIDHLAAALILQGWMECPQNSQQP